MAMSPSKFGSRLTDVCGDCGSLDPGWAIVNRGTLVCDECCSVHRSLGRHISQVKSLKKSFWIPSLLAMVTALNSAGVNNLWEHLLDSKSKRKPNPKDSVHPTKAEFIRAKHKDLQFVVKSETSKEELSQELHSSVRSSNLETSLRLLAFGADPNFYYSEKGNRPLHVAAKAGQLAQVELLLVYGADPIAKDDSGNTPAQCARLGGQREVQLRLTEACYQVTDRLIYFVSRSRLDHINSKCHFIVPEERDCIVKPQSPPGSAVIKLRQLSDAQFESLAVDVFEEVDRRETETIWQQSGASLEHGSVPFLPVNSDFSSMRNQGRQKLGTLSPREFTALVLDILNDAKRRQTREIVNGKMKDDDEPLYDSVASDEDYATAEQLAIMVAQNARGVPLNISEVGQGLVKARSSELDEDKVSSSIEELREQLILSRGQISQLTLQIHRLNNKVDEVTNENKELKSALMGSPGDTEVGREGVGCVRTASLRSDDCVGSRLKVRDTLSSGHHQDNRRPVSMYESRSALQSTGGSGSSGGVVSLEDVRLRCDQVTKGLQMLWSSVRPHTTYSPHAETVRAAVAHLSAAFPQANQEEGVRSALCQLNTSVMKLQNECTSLERTSELVRRSAYHIASAIKQIMTWTQQEKQS